MLAVMTLSAVKWSYMYFCIEYCTDVSTVLLYRITNREMYM